jgi:hypothetical protein
MLVHTGELTSPPPVVEVQLADVPPMRARLVRRAEKGVAAFAFESSSARPALIRKLYCGDGYLPAPERWSLPVALTSSLKYLASSLVRVVVSGDREPREQALS